jgi:hypothetical protein
MTKAEKTAKLKEAGLADDAIDAILGADNSEEIAALKAKIAEAEGKASGILGDKKKYQQKVDELQAKIDELEGKDLSESQKNKLELERLKSKYEAEAKARADLENQYKTERRNAELSKLAQKLKFMDKVPEDARSLLVSNEFKDLEDLGNTVLVDERLKTVSQKYAGLLAADALSGAGSKAGGASPQNNKGGIDKVLAMSDADILANPAAALAMAANQ